MKTIGITSGCFDLPHALHIEYLKKCKRQCDHLIVLIDSDRFVTENKKRVPILSEEDRRYIVQHLKPVDEAEIFDSLDELKGFVYKHTIASDTNVVVFKNCSQIYGCDTLQFPKTTLILVPDVKRYGSTTEIIEFLKTKQ